MCGEKPYFLTPRYSKEQPEYFVIFICTLWLPIKVCYRVVVDSTYYQLIKRFVGNASFSAEQLDCCPGLMHQEN